MPDSSKTLVTKTGIFLAAQGQNIFITNGDQVNVLKAQTSHPTASPKSLTGLIAGRPRLTFTVSTPEGSPRLKSVTIALPHGLRFTKHRNALKHAVVAHGTAGQTLKLTAGRLLVTFKRASPKAKVTIRPTGLDESRALRTRASRKSGKRHIGVRVTITDANQTRTERTLNFLAR